MKRKGEIYFKNVLAGILEENDDGHSFKYDDQYLKNNNPAISLSLPLSSEIYNSKTLFPFFDGLIPEGWLLDIALKNWKLNPRDRMGLLLSLCYETIGAVSVKEIKE